MDTTQYDRIGESYEGVKGLPMARYPEQFSFLRMLGDRLPGASVLDLACGTGFYTRGLKRLGAARVHGTDISAEMVAAAQAIEDRDPLGISYAVSDAARLPPPERPFDLATAIYLLNYADDEETMERMCRSVHRCLAPGAGFYILTQAPDFRFDGPPTDKYGFVYERVAEGTVGPRVRITALVDPPVTFVTNYARRDVYETALRSAGFDDLEWIALDVPEEGRQRLGDGFWDDFLANPPLVMLRCRA